MALPGGVWLATLEPDTGLVFILHARTLALQHPVQVAGELLGWTPAADGAHLWVAHLAVGHDAGSPSRVVHVALLHAPTGQLQTHHVLTHPSAPPPGARFVLAPFGRGSLSEGDGDENAAHGGVLLVIANGSLAYLPGDGSAGWQNDIGGQVVAMARVDDAYVVVAMNDSMVHLLRCDTDRPLTRDDAVYSWLALRQPHTIRATRRSVVWSEADHVAIVALPLLNNTVRPTATPVTTPTVVRRTLPSGTTVHRLALASDAAGYSRLVLLLAPGLQSANGGSWTSEAELQQLPPAVSLHTNIARSSGATDVALPTTNSAVFCVPDGLLSAALARSGAVTPLHLLHHSREMDSFGGLAYGPQGILVTYTRNGSQLQHWETTPVPRVIDVAFPPLPVTALSLNEDQNQAVVALGKQIIAWPFHSSAYVVLTHTPANTSVTALLWTVAPYRPDTLIAIYLPHLLMSLATPRLRQNFLLSEFGPAPLSVDGLAYTPRDDAVAVCSRAAGWALATDDTGQNVTIVTSIPTGCVALVGAAAGFVWAGTDGALYYYNSRLKPAKCRFTNSSSTSSDPRCTAAGRCDAGPLGDHADLHYNTSSSSNSDGNSAALSNHEDLHFNTSSTNSSDGRATVTAVAVSAPFVVSGDAGGYVVLWRLGEGNITTCPQLTRVQTWPLVARVLDVGVTRDGNVAVITAGRGLRLLVPPSATSTLPVSPVDGYPAVAPAPALATSPLPTLLTSSTSSTTTTTPFSPSAPGAGRSAGDGAGDVGVWTAVGLVLALLVMGGLLLAWRWRRAHVQVTVIAARAPLLAEHVWEEARQEFQRVFGDTLIGTASLQQQQQQQGSMWTRADFSLGDVIGTGHFGMVHTATPVSARAQAVVGSANCMALKSFGATTAEDQKAVLLEALLLESAQHAHIITFYGVVVDRCVCVGGGVCVRKEWEQWREQWLCGW